MSLWPIGLLDASSCVKTVGNWRGLVACWELSFPIGVSKNFTYINTSAFNAVFWVRHSLQSPVGAKLPDVVEKVRHCTNPPG